ncbi:uncharacterized protein LOC114255131 [Monomorium pharaonis]|uniref:uncharacterized protein LOC114255131 n=1 Tax=Monomorium pharaonis TaxID=307658 RepID=UPI00102E1999|nr:uncharacterized protein LOC114255131 [Monomorium pharaonis]
MDHVEKIRKLTRIRVKRFRAIRKTDENYSISGPSTSIGQKWSSMTNFDTSKSEKNSDECGSQENCFVSKSASEENMDLNESAGNEVDISDESNNDGSKGDVDGSDFSQHDQYSDADQYDEEDIEEECNEIEVLREWAIKSNIKHTHLNSLLQILRRRILPELPKSSKTFLKTTSAEYEIKQFKKPNDIVIDEFVYFGIAKHLQKCVNEDLHQKNMLYLQFNIDGLPLFK